jgi:hypothetical protein
VGHQDDRLQNLENTVLALCELAAVEREAPRSGAVQLCQDMGSAGDRAHGRHGSPVARHPDPGRRGRAARLRAAGARARVMWTYLFLALMLLARLWYKLR